MKKLINPNIAPIGGFRFVDPDTSYHYTNHATFDALETAVQAYRQSNELPRIAKFRAIWEHFVCENTPGMAGRCTQCAAVITRSFEQYFAGGKSFIRAILGGAKSFVEQLTADRRGAVCKGCDQNVVNIGHSHSQFYSNGFIRAQVGNRRSKHHNDLHTCKICSCILKAKVFYNDEVVAGSVTDAEIVKLTRLPRDGSGRHLKCWQLSALESSLEKETEDGIAYEQTQKEEKEA